VRYVHLFFLVSGGGAVTAWIAHALKQAVGVANNRPGVAHDFAEIGQHFDVVPQLAQAGDDFGAEATFQLE